MQGTGVFVDGCVFGLPGSGSPVVSGTGQSTGFDFGFADEFGVDDFADERGVLEWFSKGLSRIFYVN